jgi:predicted porin
MNVKKAKKAIYSVAALGVLLLAPQAMAAATNVENASLDELRQLIMQQQEQISAQDKAIKALQAGQPMQAAMDQTSVTPVDKLVQSGNDKVSLTLYGQVNRAVMWADDGYDEEVYHVDNDNSSTRFGMKGSARASDDLSAGFKFEAEYEGNSSSEITQEEEDKDASLKKRHMDVYLQSKQFGKLSIGQGDTASNGISEIDLSGTTVIGFSDQPKIGGKLLFYDGQANDYTGIKIKDVMSNMDGLGRADRVRYDTPAFYGLSVATSTVEQNGNDVALRYSGKLGSTKLAAGIAYAQMGSNDAEVNNTISGSVSTLLACGFNATFAAGTQDLEQPAAGHDDPTFWYGKIGYIGNFFSAGTTAFAIDYGQYDEVDQADDDADTFGLMAVQKLNDLGTELYASYRVFSLDRTATNIEDIDIFMTGARIKF